MPVILQFTLRTDGAENFRPADMQRAGRVAMYLVGKLFHRYYKPRKFGENAAQIYRLKPRARRYRLAKRYRLENGQGVRAIGDDRPFVWSGTTRRLVMGSDKVVSRAPSSERHYCLITLVAPQLNRLPWVREELERVNKNELKQLGRYGSERYEKELLRRGKPRVRRA